MFPSSQNILSKKTPQYLVGKGDWRQGSVERGGLKRRHSSTNLLATITNGRRVIPGSCKSRIVIPLIGETRDDQAHSVMSMKRF